MKISQFIFSLTALLVAQFVRRAKAGSSGNRVSSPVVRVNNGSVYGRYNKEWDQEFFLGIPYAQAPIGDLRFRPPQYIDRKLGSIIAREYGPHCYGVGPDQLGYQQSEDCLTINIIRPAGIRMRDKLPVAVWIHGGGFYQGGAGDIRYNLTWMVHQSVKMDKHIIGVSMNYRLAGWGFLASREVAGTHNLNNGLKDQRLALHWIKENIGAFGGDPHKVTIFGESAGGAAVGFQTIAFNGRDDGLFRGAIMQSGGSVQYQSSQYATDFQTSYDTVSQAVGCIDKAESLQCLRGIPASVLNATFTATLFNPVIDGAFVPGFGSEALKYGRYVKVPTIAGTTSDEGCSFGQISANSDTDIANWLATTTSFRTSSIQKILRLYDGISIPPEGNFTNYPDDGTKYGILIYGKLFHKAAAIIGDWLFIAGRRYITKTLAAHSVPVWSYRFRARPNGSQTWYRAAHFAEVAFVFNNVEGLGYNSSYDHGNPMGGEHAIDYRKLGDFMSRSWVAFVHSLDPRVGAKPNEIKWNPYRDGNGKSQIVFDIDADGGIFMETDDYREEEIGFMNSYILQATR
ncbi:Acetylcholinesterase [Drechslerella dactyloides]|uniref:Carboxylic ester hydrolase n=1 Tax=Drechslerella dactyloides TaxID=74499 RepID=A0AAD6NG08_DREDA|nr:Acetylcholinesterase [Drechslerella dactyloides]